MLDKGLMEDGKKCITKREADKATVVPVEESKWDLPCHTLSRSPLLLPPPLLDLLILQAPMTQLLNLFYSVCSHTS